MAEFQHEEITFHYDVTGEGHPLVFSHGLSWNLHRPQELLGHPAGHQLITWDMRAHGTTSPIGPAEKLSFQTFASDQAALMDYLGIGSAVVGGISMGAAVALQFAVDYPGRASGLLLLQPSWSPVGYAPHLDVFIEIADLLDQFGAEKGLARFESKPELKQLRQSAPNAAASLMGQFRKPHAAERSIRLRVMPNDRPLGDWDRVVGSPTLVIGTISDPIHPMECAEQWARHIPGARLICVTPKESDPERYVQEVRQEVQRFLCQIQHASTTVEKVARAKT